MKKVNWDLEGSDFYKQFGISVETLTAAQITELELAVERATWEIDGYRKADGTLVAPTEFGADEFNCTGAYLEGQLEEMGVAQ